MPAETAKFKSRRDRIHHALRMYHGIGCEEHDVEEIADYLNVQVKTVQEYIYESPQSEEIEKALEQVASETRKEIVMDLRQRLRDLRELEEELKDAVEVVVTDFRFENVELEVSGAPGKGVTVAEDADATYDGQVPVPDRVKEVPQFRRLQKVWEEQSRVMEQLSNVLGLEEPEQVEVSGELTERKLWQLGEDPEEAGFPEQEVEDLEDSDSI